MNIPDSCSAWREQMTAGAETSQVLDNVERDPCVPGDRERKSFQSLAESGPWHSPEEAMQAGMSVVTMHPDELYCTGREVPADRMNSLVRFVRLRDIIWLIPDSETERKEMLVQKLPFLRRKRPRHPLSRAHRDSLKQDLGRDLRVGRDEGVAWVTDDTVLPGTNAPLRTIVQRLGLTHFKDDAWLIVLRYNRDDVPHSLHVPRSLDAMGHPAFEVQTDCSAPVGMTKPLPEAPEGVVGCPEAVHRSTRVRVAGMEARYI